MATPGPTEKYLNGRELILGPYSRKQLREGLDRCESKVDELLARVAELEAKWREQEAS